MSEDAAGTSELNEWLVETYDFMQKLADMIDVTVGDETNILKSLVSSIVDTKTLTIDFCLASCRPYELQSAQSVISRESPKTSPNVESDES